MAKRRHIFGETHPGLVREANEDALLFSEEQGWVIVADGMGGHNAGEVASHLAVESLAEDFRLAHGSSVADRRQLLEQAINNASLNVYDAAHAIPEYQGMGTTLAAAWLVDDILVYGYVGDSRIYLFHERELRQLTHDHTMIQGLIDEGIFDNVAQARHAGVRSNVLTRALGIEPEVEAEYGLQELRSGDLLLFCTDGLTDALDDQELRDVLLGADQGLWLTVESLVDRACAAGGADNITAVLVRIS